MNDRSKTGLQILQLAIGLGILGDILLRHMPWGLNVLLFNLAFVAATIVLLLKRKPEYLTPQTWALLAAQIFFAAMFVLRDSAELRFADSVAIVAVMSVVFLPKLKVPPRVAGLFHYAVGFLWAALNSAFAAAALLAADIQWKTEDRSNWARNTVAAIRGVLIALPLVLIFGALFMAADLAYDQTVRRTLNINFETIFSHSVIFAVFAWATAGYLRGLVIGFEPKPAGGSGPESATPTDDRAPSSDGSKVDGLKNDTEAAQTTIPDGISILEHINRSDPPAPMNESAEASPKTKGFLQKWPNVDNSILPSAFTLGSVEVGVILGLMNLLFLSFVVFQIPYLFGGMDLVRNTPDFKLADYARRGFGELVAVSALVLPTLLIGHWLVKKDSPFTEKLFKALASIQIVLLFVIMASAVQRLLLLTGNLGYGLTTVRLYPMIFMTWLGIVFVWFALTVLRGYRKYFAWGALWSAFFILGATHFLNPDEFIVKTNVQLMQQGREFDVKYNSRLSDDAIPVLVDALPLLNEADQKTVFSQLARRTCRSKSGNDLRDWNYSREQAAARLAPYAEMLSDAAPPCVSD
jgi:hypothetical protein